MTNRLKLIFLSLIVTLASCKKDDPVEPEPAVKSVLIGNQGVNPNGISTFTEYNPNSGEVNQNVYRKKNIDAPGSFVNDILIDGDEIYMIMRVSSTLLIADANTYKLKEKIVLDGSPRRILKVDEGKFYITDANTARIKVFNRTAKKVTKTIKVGDSPDRMFSYKDMVFVANTGMLNRDSSVTLVRSSVDTVITTMYVGDRPNSFAMDSDNENLYVLCQGYSSPGDILATTASQVRKFRMDSIYQAIENGWDINAEMKTEFSNMEIRGVDLFISSSDEYLYFLGNNDPGGNGHGLMRMSAKTLQEPITPFVEGIFYTLAYDPFNDELYASSGTAGNFDAEMYRYKTSDGSLIARFMAGVYPRPIAFKK